MRQPPLCPPTPIPRALRTTSPIPTQSAVPLRVFPARSPTAVVPARWTRQRRSTTCAAEPPPPLLPFRVRARASRPPPSLVLAIRRTPSPSHYRAARSSCHPPQPRSALPRASRDTLSTAAVAVERRCSHLRSPPRARRRDPCAYCAPCGGRFPRSVGPSGHCVPRSVRRTPRPNTTR
ncbi:hypothetical protein HYPSUDRAFT_587114 [Hypholoma sublateritium FD-334 SS-4]|uniref:Uncharacterized protein n=1 Tax=Hypholoma sublateritium (strain FD-334 SS-4) TaxID=945553 RepID=A0A0D2MIG1_HYPSF|nr:hypothetical protein HYPSUDRAFT_587114 [Hypholoma sublateritium FD-334 SS-4]